jgi:hypothetical protein
MRLLPLAVLMSASLAGCTASPSWSRRAGGSAGETTSTPPLDTIPPGEEKSREAGSSATGTATRSTFWPLDDLDATTAPSAADSNSEKSYLVPAVEIISFELLLNLYDREYENENTYGTDSDSIHENLHRGWVWDRDPFAVNQLGHPYAGSIYHGFARSSGLNYWESLGYTFAGSWLWEVAGETGSPSANDQISTGIGGSFLGEALYRTATWVLDNGHGKPSVGNTLGAGALSPSATFNRFVYSDRFRAAAPTTDPVVLTRAGIGAKTNTHVDDDGRSNTDESTDLLAEFSVDYGLPGKTGYSYTKPFDYFHFEVGGLSDSHNHVDRAIARGLLVGDDYEIGDDYKGVWGLYGSYDYISPGVFRVASTAVSVGTTAQQLLSDRIALQGSVLGGIGFGAAGTVSDDQEQRDYHYGEIPQALVDLRLVFGESSILQVTGRDYYVLGGSINDVGGDENIAQVAVSWTFRVSGPHALSLQYTASTRVAQFDVAPDQDQSVESVSLVYSFLGGAEFGATR